MAEDKFKVMTTEPVHRLVCKLAVPTIVSMLITSIYNMADTFFMGKINTQATAAVGVAFSLMSVIQAVGFFFGHGSGNFISRRLGARDFGSAHSMAATGFVYAFMAGVLIAVCGLVFLKPLCLLLGSTPTILPYSMKYVGIILLGAPFMTSSLVLNNQMRFQGYAAYAMVGIVTGALLNIALAPLLIFVLDMGIAGAALATVVCQMISFGLLLAIDRKKSSIPIELKRFTPKASFAKEILRGGSPSLSRQGLACVGTLLLNLSAGRYGDAAIAAMSIVTRACMFVFSFLIGFGQGFQPVCGFNYGAARYSRVKEGFWFCVKVGTAFLAVCSLVGWWQAPLVVRLFRHDPEVVAIGTVALRCQLVVLPFNAFVTISNMMMQTIRMPGRAILLASARQGLFFVPLIFILPSLFGLTGVEVCQTVADALSFLLAIPVAHSVLRELSAKQNANSISA